MGLGKIGNYCEQGQVSFWVDENFNEISYQWWLYNYECTKTTELYTLKWWIEWYRN